MDTSILHSRIEEYKVKAKHPTSKEMIFFFETWLTSLENYVSGIEMDNFEAQSKINQQQDTINLLFDLLIISGYADVLIGVDLNDKYIIEAINLLLKSKDRKNYKSLHAIASLLYINSDRKFESLKQLKEYVDGE